jgi:hypothetical protein
MSEKEEKGLGSKFLGLFVERPEGEDAASADKNKSPADLVAELAAKSGVPRPAPEAPPPNLKLDKMATGGGAPADFDAIFKDAGMDAAELDRVKKAEDLLKGLPDAIPQESKRQIVETSLKAFGFEIDKIVHAAQNQQKALDAYVRVNSTVTAKALTEAEAQIKALHDKVAGLKAEIEKKNANLKSLSEAAQARKTQVQKVLDFFNRPAATP